MLTHDDVPQLALDITDMLSRARARLCKVVHCAPVHAVGVECPQVVCLLNDHATAVLAIAGEQLPTEQ